MKLFHLVFCLVTVALAVAPRLARADQTGPVAVMQCDGQHDRMLLRLGMNDPGTNPASDIGSAQYAPIPKTLTKAWSGIPYKQAGKCRFRDGQTVSVTTTSGPSGEGEGEADASQSFTMTIEGRLAYAGFPYYSGGGDLMGTGYGFPIAAVEYDGKHLIECNPNFYGRNAFKYGTGSGPARPTCHDVSNRLLPGDKAMTARERATVPLIKLKKKLSASLTPFCKTLKYDVEHSSGKQSKQSPFQSVQFHHQQYLSGDYISRTSLDLNNTGTPILVFMIWAQNNVFSGDYLLAFPRGSKPDQAKFLADMTSGKRFDLDRHPAATARSLWNATFISLPHPGAFYRYNDNIPFVYDNKTYIFSKPDSNPSAVPSAIVSMINPAGNVKRICTYP